MMKKIINYIGVFLMVLLLVNVLAVFVRYVFQPEFYSVDNLPAELAMFEKKANPKADEGVFFYQREVDGAYEGEEVVMLEYSDGLFAANPLDVMVFAAGGEELYQSSVNLDSVVFSSWMDGVFVEHDEGVVYQLVDDGGRLVERMGGWSVVATVLVVVFPFGGVVLEAYFLYLVLVVVGSMVAWRYFFGRK